MKFKLDENLGHRVADQLRRAGHDVMLVREQGLGGHEDRVVSEVCRAEARILITLDLDFANILSYPPWRYAGIVVLRLAEPISWQKLASAVETLLRGLEQRSIHQKLWIVDHRGRIRESGGEEPIAD